MNLILSILLCSGMTLNSISTEIIENNNEIQTNTINVQEEFIENDDNDEISLLSYFEDQYEPNDNMSDATEICPSNFYSLNSYNINIDATLDYSASIQDVDFYYLTLFTDSNVNIEVEADSSYSGNFDFSLMNYNYYSVSNGYAHHWPEDVVSNYNGTRLISYTLTLKPGTYLIYLRGRQNSSVTNDLPYSLNVNVSKVTQYPNILVSDLKNDTDIKGALWLSDFIPTNNFSIFDLNSDYIYYKAIEQNLNYPDYALDKMRVVSNGNPIKLANYYIWDPLLKHVLHEIFVVIRNEFNDMLEENEKIAGELSLQYDTITGILSVVFDIVGYIPMPVPVSLCVDVLDIVTFAVIDSYFNSIMPEFNVNQSQYLSFISTIAAYTDLGLTEEEKQSVDAIYAKDTEREIIQIPVYYRLGINEKTFSTYDEHYYSLKATSSEFFNYSSLIYNDTYFYSSFDNDYYCRGKIYEINNFSDLTNFENLELAQSHTHNYDNHYCTICNLYTESHDYDYSYIYLNGTTHKANCVCGEYVIQGHAVVSGGSICVKCKRKVDMGFVEITNNSINFNNVSINGSYILPNGVIVLVEEDIESYLDGTLQFYDKNLSTI